MASSKDWRNYYEENARTLLTIPWERGGDLTTEEISAVGRSLREFQAGESSEGRQLMKRASEYGARTGDADYLEAIKLFIAEEQRHARDLARVLALNQIELVRTTFTDRIFRGLRHMVGTLEVSIAVLVTAEIIAKVYYAVLQEATASVVLRRLCDQILRDELKHVEFQADRLAQLRRQRKGIARALTSGLQRFLFFGTVRVVWIFHRPVIVRGGMSWKTWSICCWREFDRAFAADLGR